VPHEHGALGDVRALVLDPDSHVSLGACRGLARAGAAVEVAGDRFAGIAERSRYVRAAHLLPDACGPAAPYADALRSLIETRRFDAVVSTDDATIARLDSIDLSVPSVPSLGAPRHVLVDKAGGLPEHCAATGVAYPDTFLVPEGDDGRELVAAALPAVVKARRSAVARPDAVAHARGARPVDTVEDGVRRVARLRSCGLEPIVQRRVAKSRKLGVVLLRRAAVLEIAYAHVVLREYPVGGGRAAAVRTARRGDEGAIRAIELCERVCAAARYEGVVHGELLEHAEGTTLIELNPRLSGTTWFREQLGLQPTERSVRLALGLPPLPPVRVPAGRTFHVLPLEARVAARSGRWSGVRALGWWRPGDRIDGISLTDPWPTVRHYVGRLSRNHE
jgi:hypothetical protein